MGMKCHMPAPAASGPIGTSVAGAGSGCPGTTVPGEPLPAGEGKRDEADASGLAGPLTRAGVDPWPATPPLHEARARLTAASDGSARHPRIPTPP